MRWLSSVFVLVFWLAFSTVNAADSRDDKNAKRLKSAQKLIKAREYDAAVVVLQSILDEVGDDDPLYLQALYNEAYALEQDKKTPEALEAYNQCLELIAAQSDPGANGRVAEKCKKAVLRLDKSRRIILRHAAQIEKEAARFKGKDDYAYKKMMEIVKVMRGAWEHEKKTKPEKDVATIKSRISKRYRTFYGAVAAGDMDKAVKYVDPQIRKYAGDAKIIGYLRAMEGALKIAQVSKTGISIKKITLSKDKKSARIIGRLRMPHGVEDSDPNLWVMREDKWYLGDQDKLKDFK